MNASLFVQWSLIAIVLLVSVVYLSYRQWPKAFGSARRSLVIWMLRSQRWEWMRRVGRVLAPAPTVRVVSGGACGGCAGCGTASAK